MINETLFHDEFAIYRAVTGGAYNIPGAYGVIQKGVSFPAKGSIPVATQHFGTIKSDGVIVRGLGTQFGLLNKGDYLYHKEVVRQIKDIIADDQLILEQEFPSDITVGETPLVCKRQTFKMVNIYSSAEDTAAILQEAPIAAGDRILSGGAPLSYDATAGQLTFTVHK